MKDEIEGRALSDVVVQKSATPFLCLSIKGGGVGSGGIPSLAYEDCYKYTEVFVEIISPSIQKYPTTKSS